MNQRDLGQIGKVLPEYKISVNDGMLKFLLDVPRGRPRPTVFLDRDGVLNRRIVGGYVTEWSQFALLPRVKEALHGLTAGHFQLVLVSNQAGVAKRQLSCETLIEITKRSLEDFRTANIVIDGAFFCLHQPADECACRKPKPGLLHAAMRELPVDVGRSFLIGDSAADIEAGAAVGATTILVSEEPVPEVDAKKFVKDLEEAARWILGSAAAGH